ncbi:LysE family transporter [Natronoglycomyces albus]|uniref:LysE family transporter n=1 Tax=Natronoglycomyces albus TaxID=2811108 RepID=A0A895XMD8_9ACTN|nr:LysE family transporter [Natronoglycomyces albus]
MNLLNPKAILFSTALLRQFIDPHYAHPAISYLMLALVQLPIELAYMPVLIFLGQRLAPALGPSSPAASAGHTFAGGVLFTFATKLALTLRHWFAPVH